MDSLFSLVTSNQTVIVGFLGALLGAAIAFLATIISNRSQTKRLNIQLAHDAEQRAQERAMQARKEVYFSAAEEISRMIEFISRFTYSKIQGPNDFKALLGSGGTFNKVHIVASYGTIEKMTRLNEKFAELICALLPKRLSIFFKEKELEHAVERAKSLSSEREEIFTALKEINGQNPGNRRLIESLTQRWERVLAAINSNQEQKKQIGMEIYHLQENLLLECSQAAIAFYDFVVPANIAVRQELNLPLEAHEYETLVERSSQNMSRLHARLVDDLHTLMNGLLDQESNSE